VEFLRHYLEIEKTRFSDRLTLEFNIGPETSGALVPAMILQPLVENSIKHGVSRVGGAGKIGITAVRTNGRLRLTVANTGQDLGGDPPAAGVGLSNTRSRLKHLYGERQEFRLHARGPDGAPGVTAEIILPFHTEPEGEGP